MRRLNCCRDLLLSQKYSLISTATFFKQMGNTAEQANQNPFGSCVGLERNL